MMNTSGSLLFFETVLNNFIVWRKSRFYFLLSYIFVRFVAKTIISTKHLSFHPWFSSVSEYYGLALNYYCWNRRGFKTKISCTPGLKNKKPFHFLITNKAVNAGMAGFFMGEIMHTQGSFQAIFLRIATGNLKFQNLLQSTYEKVA